MSSRVTWTGLEELKVALKNLPAQLAADAEEIVDNRAEITKAAVIQGYAVRTGSLRRGVSIRTLPKGPLGRGRQVLSRAPHAHLYDNRGKGTKQRRTRRGANRGRMPPRDVMVPIAKRQRALMEDEIARMLTAAGFKVTRT